MKANKFFFAAMMVAALGFVSCNPQGEEENPQIKSDTPEVAATDGAVTVVWNIANISDMCDVEYVFAGNYNNWQIEPSVMAHFEPIADYDGWYKAVITLDGVDHLEGKPCALGLDGTFPSGWDFQWIGIEDHPCEVLKGDASLEVEYDVESKLVCGETADVVFVKSYGFKTNPCVEATYDDVTFNLTVTVPVTDGGTVYIVGDAFEKSWDQTAYPMTGSGSNWTITLPTIVGKNYKFCVDANWDNDQMNAPEDEGGCFKKAGNMTVDFTTMNDVVYGFLNFGLDPANVCADEDETGEETVDVKVGDQLVVNVKLGEGLTINDNKLYVYSWNTGDDQKDFKEMTLSNGVYTYTYTVVDGWDDSGMLFVDANDWDSKSGQTADIKPVQAGTWTINSDWTLTKE